MIRRPRSSDEPEANPAGIFAPVAQPSHPATRLDLCNGGTKDSFVSARRSFRSDGSPHGHDRITHNLAGVRSGYGRREGARRRAEAAAGGSRPSPLRLKFPAGVSGETCDVLSTLLHQLSVSVLREISFRYCEGAEQN